MARSVLKIRYLLLGGAISGGASLASYYEDWKRQLPDTEWIKALIPEVDLAKFRSGLIDAADKIKGKANELDIDPALRFVCCKIIHLGFINFAPNCKR